MRILQETFMEAAGPQGPVPANETVIEGLPRFTFDTDSLGRLSPIREIPLDTDPIIKHPILNSKKPIPRLPCV